LQKITFLIGFLFLVTISSGQGLATSKRLNGKVTADYNDLEGIYIVNLKTERATLTERGGYFSITASVGDTLMFSAVQFKGLKVALKESDFAKELLFVKLETLVRSLDEVRINEYKNINAVSLGIISPNTKHYTPAERKLRTAEELHWYSPLLIPLGGMSVDGMINSISGRTAMLKKEVEVEKKEFLLQKIDNLFDKKYFLETLKIPEDYIKGFQYYIVEDVKFVEAMNAKNKTMATFIMNELAVKYKELLLEKK
jgi:hypothetical protein